MAKQTVFGPYRVKNFGANGDIYEIVSMMDNHTNEFEYLLPRRSYAKEKRTSAYRAVALLNRKWQCEHEFEFDLLEYWKEATN